MNKWETIWNNKESVTESDHKDEFQRFCELKKANGFDVAVENEDSYFRNFYQGWIDFYNKITELIGSDFHSVYEVGCGSGVNLFMFKNRMSEKSKWGGCDYSSSMVNSARISTGCNDFVCCGADEITVQEKYDIVMAESVFQYFETQEYAESVLRKMIQKSNRLTYLGEIHDKRYEAELIDYRRRTIENYEEKYEGLSKLFLSREWIENFAKEYDKKILFTDVDNPDYLNGKYEFNCFIF